MQSVLRKGFYRVLGATVAVATMAACSDATRTLSSPEPAAGASTAPQDPASSSDTSTTPPVGEWHLATIRGQVIGLSRTVGSPPGDTLASSLNVVAGATVEIHKISLNTVAPSTGDTATMKLADLGVVATVTTNTAGRFEYVISDPLIVKTGQPSPTVTYRLTITPPATSPFAAQSGMQVLFAEQLPGDGTSNYYLFLPKK